VLFQSPFHLALDVAQLDLNQTRLRFELGSKLSFIDRFDLGFNR
jgi:hypothetical protein